MDLSENLINVDDHYRINEPTSTIGKTFQRQLRIYEYILRGAFEK